MCQLTVSHYIYMCFSFSKMDSNNHFNYGTHSSANSGLKLSSGDSLYTNGSSMSFPQQGKSEYIRLLQSVDAYFLHILSKTVVPEWTHVSVKQVREISSSFSLACRYEWRNECEWRHYCTRVQPSWFPPANGPLSTHGQPPPGQRHGL